MNSVSQVLVPISQTETESPPRQRLPEVSTNDAPAHSASDAPAEGMALGAFDARVVELAPLLMMYSYLLLWLLVLLYLAYRIWQWRHHRHKRRTS
jgi:hypothetical protein